MIALVRSLKKNDCFGMHWIRASVIKKKKKGQRLGQSCENILKFM